MSKARDRLQVNWSFADPPLPASKWHKFQGPLTPNADEASLSKKLGWPSETVTLLRLALELGLTRKVGWDAPEGLVEAARMGARYFRRGVAAKGVVPVSRHGGYEIRLYDGSTDPLALLDGDFVVVDAGVAAAHPHAAKKASGVFRFTERDKTLTSVAAILDLWRLRGQPKHWTIVGGGLLGDVAGFAAHLAGASFAFVPTTLLAIADACVGGKTGVNAPPFGKNQIGAFAFPTAVDVWPGWLETLPPRELAAGGAECLKHALLSGDRDLSRALATSLTMRDLAALGKELLRVISVKVDVVQEDPAETGRRATLNLGHTFGHALEALCHNQGGEDVLLHGEAVGAGLVFAIHLSVIAGGLTHPAADQMLADLFAAGVVPSRQLIERALGGCDLSQDQQIWSRIKSLIALDKKIGDRTASGGSWVLLEDWGKPLAGDGSYTIPVDQAALDRAYERWLASFSS